MEPRLARLGQRLPHDVDGDAADLDVHLQRRDPLLGAGDLEVHVAVVILAAHDVGEDADLVAFLDESHRDARHRRLERHARVHERHEAPQTLAIDDEPLDSRISDTTRTVYGNTSRAGITASIARWASAPWPISRRPGVPKRLTSPVENEGKL